MQYHNGGNFPQAEQLYRAILVTQPNHLDAPLCPEVALRDGEYSDLAGAGVVLITAGINEKSGGAIDRNYTGKGLQLEFTVEDEGVFTMPWSATITYGRDANSYWEERVCAENVQHDYEANYYSDKNAHLPTADRPDF